MADSCLVVAAGSKVPTLYPTLSLAQDLIYPLPLEAFLSDTFGTKCAHFKCSNPNRIKQLVAAYLFHGDVKALCDATPSDAVHCWLRMTKDSASERIESIKVADTKDALTLHKAGASLYFRAPAALEQAFLPALTEGLGMGFAAFYDFGQAQHRGEVETFVSRKGHITRWHWDFMENFTVQISGRKRWRLCRSNVTAPLRGTTPHYNTGADVVEQQVKCHRMVDSDFAFSPSPDFFKDCTEVELGPGDVFYFPAGMWHEVIAVEDSISINFSLVTQTWADLTSAAIRHALWRHVDFRSMIRMPTAALPLSDKPRSSGSKRKFADISGAAATSNPVASSAAKPDIPSYALGHAMSAIKESLAAKLDYLKQVVNSLQPDMLITPAMRISRRFGSIPGARDATGPANPVFDLKHMRKAYGFDVWYFNEQLVLTVLPVRPKWKPAAFPKAFSWNVLSVLHWSSDVGLEGDIDAHLLDDASESDASVPENGVTDDAEDDDDDDDDDGEEEGGDEKTEGLAAPPRPEGYESVVVHVNFGAEELASQSRVVVQFPSSIASCVRRLAEHVAANNSSKPDPVVSTLPAPTKPLEIAVYHSLAFAGYLVVA